MSQKKRQNVRKGIIRSLSKESPLTYTQLQRKLSTNYRSVQENCDELKSYGIISIESKKKHPRNKHDYFEVSLTKEGISVAKNIKPD